MSDIPFADEARWKSAASQAITKLARSGKAFTAADLIAMVGPPPVPSLPATVFRAAHLGGLIEKDAAAQVGTVWVGKVTVKQPRERAGPGRRKVDRHKIPEKIWSDAHDQAKAEGIPTGEVVARAVRAHLKKKR
ncbi:MAG TPA: hypothetical protein VE007_06010 [Thermoanaerobaculia bacterium]|nr:hypothetical protein [Thermoanaerobaculia bacterium]